MSSMCSIPTDTRNCVGTNTPPYPCFRYFLASAWWGLEGKQVGAVLGVVEHVGSRLVNGYRPAVGGGVGLLPGVELKGVEVQ